MDLDPQLEADLRSAGDQGQVEALLLMVQGPCASGDDRGAAGPVLDRVTEQVHEKPTKVRFMPKLGGLFIRGSGRLVRRLLDQSEVITASSNGP